MLLINSLVAGVVTYYWAAAAVLRAPGHVYDHGHRGLIGAPFALVVGLRAMPAITFSGTSPRAQALVALLIGALIFLGIAILFGLVLFGLYAYAGASRWTGCDSRRWPGGLRSVSSRRRSSGRCFSCSSWPV